MYIDFEQFGQEVRKIRKSLHLTQVKVYQYTDISVETQRRIEKGIQEPKLSTLEKLSYYYKVDLISLLTNHRTSDNLLSDKSIKKITICLRSHDYSKLKSIAVQMISNLSFDNNHSSSKSNKYLENLLKSFQNIDFCHTSNLYSNIENTENFILHLQRKAGPIGGEKYFYNIEVISIIFLIAFLRQNHQYERAIELSNLMIVRLENYPHTTPRIINYIGSLYLNLAYVYHHLDDHQRVINTVKKCFEKKILVFSNDLYCELLYREAIALFNLGNPLYKPFIQVFMSNIDEHKKHTYCQILTDEYSIKHNTCSKCIKSI